MHAKINGISMCLSGHYRCGYHSDSYGSDFVKICKALGVFLLSDWYLFCNLARSFHRPISSLVFFLISNRFGGRTCNCFKEAPTLPTTSGKETRERTAWSMPAKAARDLPKHLNHSSRPLHFLVVFVAWFYFDSAVISQLKTWPVLVCYALLLVRSLAIQPLVLSYSVLWIRFSSIQFVQVCKISTNLILICMFWIKFKFLLSLIIQFFYFI